MFPTTRHLLSAAILIMSVFNACSDKQPASSSVQRVPQQTTAMQDKQKNVNVDKSPMDMIYFPADYPVLKMSGKATGLPIARVIYSRPYKDGRPIFGNVVKYGEYWRLGANEGTELEFFRDVTISGKTVKKGRYIIYAIPQPNQWTIVLNDDLYSWGLRIHKLEDVYSFDIPSTKSNQVYEVFTMEFGALNEGAQLGMAWDTVKAYLPFTY